MIPAGSVVALRAGRALPWGIIPFISRNFTKYMKKYVVWSTIISLVLVGVLLITDKVSADDKVLSASSVCPQIPIPDCEDNYVVKVSASNCPLQYACRSVEGRKCGELKCAKAYFDTAKNACACGQNTVSDSSKIGNSINEKVYLNSLGKIVVEENNDFDKNSVLSKIIYSDGNETEMTKDKTTEKFKENSATIEITTKSNKSFTFTKYGTSSSKYSETKKDEVKTSGQISIMDGKTYLNTKEFKVMPDTASEKAIENQQLNKEVTIELKDTGKPVYEINGNKEVRLFGLFRKSMSIVSEIDASTGEVLSIKKPWWSFLSAQ